MTQNFILSKVYTSLLMAYNQWFVLIMYCVLCNWFITFEIPCQGVYDKYMWLFGRVEDIYVSVSVRNRFDHPARLLITLLHRYYPRNLLSCLTNHLGRLSRFCLTPQTAQQHFCCSQLLVAHQFLHVSQSFSRKVYLHRVPFRPAPSCCSENSGNFFSSDMACFGVVTALLLGILILKISSLELK